MTYFFLDAFSATHGTSLKCKHMVDLGFILDSSGSLRREYHKEKQFIKNVADAFNISQDGARAGVVTFSYRAQHSIKLNESENSLSFKQEVDGIPLMGYTTRIDRAFELAKAELFQVENGGRADVPKVLILLTDGSQTQDKDAKDPAKLASEIRAVGVELLVIGVGDGINKDELDRIAGGDGSVFVADSFDQLIRDDFVDQLVAGTCHQIDEGKFL